MKNLFSERYEYQKIKDLQPDEVSDGLKNRIYNLIQKCIECPNDFGIFYRGEYEMRFINRNKFIEMLWDEFFKEDIEVLRDHYVSVMTLDGYGYRIDAIRDKFYGLKEWYRIYDFIEFILNRFNPNEKFSSSLNKIFEEERTPYRIIGNLVTLLTSETEIKEVKQTLEISDKYQPVKDHLRKALALYSKKPEPDSLNSIKESISGLEALARIVLNNPKSTLGDLANKLPIHRAFREALKKIYGWTSDEGGIRHAETGEKIISAEEEAKFMLVICSAFVNYIIAKYGTHLVNKN